MRHSRALLLLALLALVLSLVVVFEPGRERPAELLPLTSLDIPTVDRLRIRRAGAPAIEVERRGSHWWLTAPWPQPVPALAYRIESALGLLAANREHSLPVAGLDLGQFELAPPLLEIEAGPEEHLLFGNTHPIHRERHVRRGEELHRVADYHFAGIDVDATEWVATAPVPPDVLIERIELPGRVLVLDVSTPTPTATATATATAEPEAEAEAEETAGATTDGVLDPALHWSGPQAEGELPAAEVADAWRQARAFRVERLQDVEVPDARARGARPEGVDPAAGTGQLPRITATTASPDGQPGLGALDSGGTVPLHGAADETGIRIGWDGGHIDFRIVRREPELVLARDELGLAWVFEGPDVRRLLGLVEVAPTPVGDVAGARATAAPAAQAARAAEISDPLLEQPPTPGQQVTPAPLPPQGPDRDPGPAAP